MLIIWMTQQIFSMNSSTTLSQWLCEWEICIILILFYFKNCTLLQLYCLKGGVWMHWLFQSSSTPPHSHCATDQLLPAQPRSLSWKHRQHHYSHFWETGEHKWIKYAGLHLGHDKICIYLCFSVSIFLVGALYLSHSDRLPISLWTLYKKKS